MRISINESSFESHAYNVMPKKYTLLPNNYFKCEKLHSDERRIKNTKHLVQIQCTHVSIYVRISKAIQIHTHLTVLKVSIYEYIFFESLKLNTEIVHNRIF